MSEAKHDRRVVEGFRLPFDGPPTENELSWIKVLRLIFNEDVPAPNIKAAKAINTIRNL